mgnify:CR=1 FL=1
MDVIIVMILIFAATGIVFRSIKNFYLGTYSTVISTVIAAITSIMMFFSGMMLFYPKQYTRGTTASEVDLTITNVAVLVLVVAVIYYLFTYRSLQKK